MKNTIFRQKRLAKNKKGSIELIVIAVVMLVLGLAFFFIQYAMNSINDELQSDDTLTADGKAMYQSNTTSLNQVWDYGFGFLFFGLLLSVIISSYFIDSHPVFFVVSLVIFLFVIFIGGVITNVFDETTGDSEFSSMQQNFPVMMFVMDNLIMELIIGFVFVSIALYGKSRGGM